MKLGISVWAMPGEWNLETKFKKAKEAGFDGVEVALERGGDINFETTDKELLDIKILAANCGIELYSVACGLGFECPVGHCDEGKRAEGIEIIKRQLHVAKVLGCNTILVVPANITEESDYETSYKNATEALKVLAHTAESFGVKIAVENVWNKFLMSPIEMRAFVDEVASPFVQAYFDIGNVQNFGYPEQWIKILGSRIKKVHIKDFDAGKGNLSGFNVRLCEGSVNFAAAIKALNEIGYNGWITAETPFDGNNPEESNKYTCAAMKKIIKM